MNGKRRVAFVHNFATHYTAPLFELLSERYDIDFYFSSEGTDWWWPKEHGVRTGRFKQRLPRSLGVGRFRVAPGLVFELWRGRYEAYVKSTPGRFEVFTTYVVARLRRRPFILWTGLWFRVETPFHKLIFPLLRHIYRTADAVVTYGEHVKRYLVGEGVDPDRIFVTKHAVDNAAYRRPVSEAATTALREELGATPGLDIVLFVGRLEEMKGLPCLLEAVAQLQETFLLVVVGSGSLEAELRQLAARLGVTERVRFVGYVAVDDLARYYASATLLVLPSISTPRVREPWGLVVNEAFNQGVPVITSESVGAAAGGLVENGVTGMVVAERCATELSNAIKKLLNDPSLRHRLGEAGRARVLEWSHESMAQTFSTAIERVCADATTGSHPA